MTSLKTVEQMSRSCEKNRRQVCRARRRRAFTPNRTYTGVMGFKYTVQDAQSNYTQVTSPTGQTVAMKAAVYLQTSDIPNDPLAVEQWYLADTNVFAAWGTAAEQAAGQGYSGKGIRIGQFEPGGPFSTGPEVFDYRHPDLAPNADKAWLNTLDSQGNNITPQTFSNHATMVAGVMVAARNGEGGVGVAYDASLAGRYRKRSCLRTYLLGYRHKRQWKCAKLKGLTAFVAVSVSI